MTAAHCGVVLTFQEWPDSGKVETFQTNLNGVIGSYQYSLKDQIWSSALWKAKREVDKNQYGHLFVQNNTSFFNVVFIRKS